MGAARHVQRTHCLPFLFVGFHNIMAIIKVRQDGVDAFTTLNGALSDGGTGAGDTISIEGTWSVDDTVAATVVDDNITITCDADSRNPGYPHSGSGTWYRHRNAADAHSITMNSVVGLTLEKIDIQNKSTVTSREVVRLIPDAAHTLTLDKCVLGFASRNDQQDIIYQDVDYALTINVENCMFYNAYRAVIDLYDVRAAKIINLNSCACYDIGYSSAALSRSGVFGIYQATTDPYDVSVFNCFMHINTGTAFFTNASGGTHQTLTIDRSITNQASWSTGEWNSPTITDSLLSHNWTDDNSKSSDGDWVIVEDVTTSPYDLRLQSNVYNEAQDMHSDGTGAGLTMPSDDILDTSRAAAYECGAFTIVAAGVTVEIGKVALTFTGKALADYLATTEIPGKGSVTYTGKTLTANMARVVAVAKVALAFTGKALTILEGVIETIIKGALAFTGKTLYWSITFIIPKVALTYTGKVLIILEGVIISITKATIAFTGKVLYSSISFIIAKAAMAFTGQTLFISPTYRVVKGALAFTGKAVQTAMPRIIQLVKGALTFTGKILDAPMDVTVTIGVGGITYTGQTLLADLEAPILSGGQMRFGMRPIMH